MCGGRCCWTNHPDPQPPVHNPTAAPTPCSSLRVVRAWPLLWIELEESLSGLGV